VLISRRRLKTSHSKTALLTAFYRAVGNKEFQNRKFGSDYLAEIFLPFYVRFLIKSKRMRAKAKDKDQTRMPGVFEYVMARTAFFDEVFADALNESIPQIVLLGAGYDTRAYRFADLNKYSRIIELDNAATQNRKKKCLKNFKIEIPERVAHISMDFNKESVKDVLQCAGYEDDRKTLFIWEGVCMYLEAKSVDTILAVITDSSHRESAIAFDYAITIADDNSHKYYGAGEIIQIMKKSRSNELFKFTIDEDKIESFFDQRGLNIVRHLNHIEVEKSFLLRENGAPIGRPNGMFRLVIASPN
jgi:methyltransferase (TIGR00027 family)